MTVNPRDYDIRELRRAAHRDDLTIDDVVEEHAASAGTRGLRGGAETSPDEVLRSVLHRELSRLERSVPDERLEKPYLTSIPGAYQAELTVFEWLEFLLLRAGLRRTVEALAYYRSLGWITADVEETLCTYARDIDAPSDDQIVTLDVTDHAISLVYIARLAAMTA